MSTKVYASTIAHAARVTAITHRKARAVLQAIFLRAAHELEVSGRFAIPGVGVFTVRTRKARTIRNPVTKELMRLPETKTVHFRPSKRWVVR